MPDTDALSLVGRLSDPAGIHQPAGGIVGLDLFKQLHSAGIGGRCQRRIPEADIEHDLGLKFTAFGLGKFGCIGGQKGVYRLFRRQPGDGRKHPKGVAGQQKQVLGRIKDTAMNGVRQMADGINSSGIAGEAPIGQINTPGVRITSHIFQNGPEPPGAVINRRLILSGKIKEFGISPPFQVKNPGIRPPVGMVAQKPSAGIHGKRRLSGLLPAEKNRHIPVRARIGRTSHTKNRLRHQVTGQREHRLFDLPGIAGTAD